MNRINCSFHQCPRYCRVGTKLAPNADKNVPGAAGSAQTCSRRRQIKKIRCAREVFILKIAPDLKLLKGASDDEHARGPRIYSPGAKGWSHCVASSKVAHSEGHWEPQNLNLGSILGVGCLRRPFFCRFDHPEWWSLAEVHGCLDVDSPQTRKSRYFGD